MTSCAICGKGKLAGRNIRHKHSGLWERKAPATPRVFLPNIQKRAILQNGTTVTIKLCTKCIKRIRNFPGWKGYSIPPYSQSTTKTSPVTQEAASES
ncbi:MAG: 50S ribosomal protein L28 [Candidatus Roizmanbacteria bacterium]|nr:50S ribosomal protein L28 [Candidatus Roizmanbacteria bacterium]